MEPFESIRQSAGRLHAQLVSKGADPLKPLEIIDAAIRELELEIVSLDKGHSALTSLAMSAFTLDHGRARPMILMPHDLQKLLRLASSALTTMGRANAGNSRPMFSRGKSYCRVLSPENYTSIRP